MATELHLIALSGPLNAMLLRAIGLWRIQIIATVVTLIGSVTLAFCTEFWHVIICYGLLQGKMSAMNMPFK